MADDALAMSRIRGAGPARIVWGYRTAAELGAWSITVDRDDEDDPASLRLRLAAAHVAVVDAYALRQRPLAFVVDRPGRPVLTWPVITLDATPAGIRGELGRKGGSNRVEIRPA